MFEVEVKSWLDRNGFCELDVVDDDVFMYDIDERLIHFGVVSTSESVWFEQFEYEYGMEYCGIIPEILAFLHEIGHDCTIKNFTTDERKDDTFAKFILGMNEDYYSRMMQYWELPMEFSANMWVVDFINNHINAVEELCSIYMKYYEAV